MQCKVSSPSFRLRHTLTPNNKYSSLDLSRISVIRLPGNQRKINKGTKEVLIFLEHLNQWVTAINKEKAKLIKTTERNALKLRFRERWRNYWHATAHHVKILTYWGNRYIYWYRKSKYYDWLYHTKNPRALLLRKRLSGRRGFVSVDRRKKGF